MGGFEGCELFFGVLLGGGEVILKVYHPCGSGECCNLHCGDYLFGCVLE